MAPWLMVLCGLLLLFIVLFAVFLYRSRRLLSVSRYEIASPKIPAGFDGYHIIQLSDLHGASFGKENETLLSRMEAEAPDLVLITGDIITRQGRELSVAARLVEALAARFPTYFAMGNHEESLPEEERQVLLRSFRESGAGVLLGEKAEITAPNGETLLLAGLRPPLNTYHQLSRDFVPLEEEPLRALLGEANGEFSILMAHNPNFFPQYAAAGFDLIFSGHIHGGMVRVPFIGGVFSPETVLFPKYDAGLYRTDGSAMLLSRGLGTGRVGFRLFNRPDLVSVTLKRCDQKGF